MSNISDSLPIAQGLERYRGTTEEVRAIAALEGLLKIDKVGGKIEISGGEKTPFTQSVVDALSALNQKSGDQAVRADIAINGVSAVLNGLQLLEFGFQELAKKVVALEAEVAELKGK